MAKTTPLPSDDELRARLAELQGQRAVKAGKVQALRDERDALLADPIFARERELARAIRQAVADEGLVELDAEIGKIARALGSYRMTAESA